jgi:hypothetical protein
MVGANLTPHIYLREELLPRREAATRVDVGVDDRRAEQSIDARTIH